MALGLVCLVSPSRILRRASWPSDQSGDSTIGGRSWRPSNTTDSGIVFRPSVGILDLPATEPERSSTAVVRRLALRAGGVDLADLASGLRNQIGRPREFVRHSQVFRESATASGFAP